MRTLALLVLSRMLACFFLFAFIPSCTALPPVRHLSRAEAIRLADKEARRYSHTQLSEFQRSPVFYLADERRWYVGYRRPDRKFVDFGIGVSEETRKAAILFAP
jgi:hypothetical protein